MDSNIITYDSKRALIEPERLSKKDILLKTA